MKKSLIALSVLAAASAVAFADTNVTLYGKLDIGPAVAKTKGEAAKASLDSGNFYGSRWGIKGVEDLGGGNAVGFQLEQGIAVDTGNASSSARAFHRISRLYVNGGWGEVGVGRYGYLSSGTGPYDLIGGVLYLDAGTTSFGSTNAWNDLAGAGLRANNAVTYVSPSFGGLKVSLQYSNETTNDDSSNKWSENYHYYGIGASYNAGDLAAVLVFDVRDNKGSPVSMKPTYMINFGVSYDFGVIKPQFGYAWVDNSDIGSQHTFGLTGTSPVAGGKLSLGVRYILGDGKDDYKALYDEGKYRLLTINLLYDYPISKRTSLYGYAAWTKGSKAWSDTGIVSNLFNGSDVNTNGYAVQLGIVHSF